MADYAKSGGNIEARLGQFSEVRSISTGLLDVVPGHLSDCFDELASFSSPGFV